jgi:uncharacterized circularly permuted ATP-grasp superfamily protein/uncharacterized alpha-E superfamily protein
VSPRPLTFPAIPSAQLRPLRNRLRLSIRDAGLTDLTLADATPAGGPFWELEPTPLLLPAAEWAPLEAALRQRTRLVNALLVDLYARQEVLRDGILPPEVILNDPYYRRPRLGLTPTRLDPATLLRFDLVKTTAGWAFTDTRANTPVGLSYAVQNRRFLTQEAGELYRALPDYESIINFPLQLLDALRALSPRPTSSPHIVLLTTGPRLPFFSEHSFLARKMGLPLAQGDDLLVLDNTVYFKTIAGLERVDVIYRRLNDAHIDPVVFSTDRETAGIPGLLQCVRAGRVVIANDIGCGVAESRALHPFIPRLLRYYFAEKPLLPQLPSHTLGDIDQLEHVLDHPENYTFLPAHDPRLGQVAPPPPRLLRARGVRRPGLPPVVRENPYGFVAQTRPTFSPLLRGTRRKTPYRLSAYVLTQGKTHAVMPGGVINLGPKPPADRVGACVDVIVMAGHAGAPGTISDLEATVITGAQTTAPGSRAAESLFWLGRYLERAENAARMLYILDDVALEEIPARDRPRWLPVWRGLLEATGHAGEKITARTDPRATFGHELPWRMTLDPANPSSLLSSARAAADNARQLRDYVSPEAWSLLTRLVDRLETLARLPRPGTRAAAARPAEQPPPSLAIRAVLTDVNAFLGTAERTMLHDAGWQFLLLGEYLERAIMTCTALRHVLGALDHDAREHPDPVAASLIYRDNPELSALLRMLGSQDAYRRLYQTRSQPRFVAELLLQQTEAPRSIAHALDSLQRSLAAIRAETRDGDDEPTAAVLARTAAFVRDLRLDHAFGVAPSAHQATLGEMLAELLELLFAVQPALSDQYFNHQARLAADPGQSELPLTPGL